jgi:hypothetical protein
MAWCAPQGNIELMPKKEVLDFKLAPRPEQVDDKRPKQMEDRKHRLGGCADASPRESVRMRFLGTTTPKIRSTPSFSNAATNRSEPFAIDTRLTYLVVSGACRNHSS